MKRLILPLVVMICCASQAQTTDYKRAPNSYIYDPAVARDYNYSGILIPVKKAYAMWEGYDYLRQDGQFTSIPSGTPSASVFWEDVPGLIRAVEVETGAKPEDTKIKVSINRHLGNGNAVIAFKVNGTIYWSWHIWVTDDPTNGVSYTQGFETDIHDNAIQVKYMDRNLGALSNSFLGHNWHKSGGLLYEWGRKDPFPSLLYKDLNFIKIKSEIGYIGHKEVSTSTIPVLVRPYNEIGKNMRYAVTHPLDFIISPDNANWFSSQLHKTTGSDYIAWDLWADNYRGGNSNASSSNNALKKDSRSYELKSELDPCPNGWRIPSYYGRVTTNNNLAPFGRKNSGVNDDTTDNSLIKPDAVNAALEGIKVYPGLGMDFTDAQSGNRNIGVLSISGNYEKYPNSAAPNAALGTIYQDENSDGGLWSATFSYDGARVFGMTSDALSGFTQVGRHQVVINQTNPSHTGNAVRCMKDPNMAEIGDFVTEYFSEKENVIEEGMDNPNTYLITTQTSVDIPVNKAFAVYSQWLTSEELPDYSQLKAKVLWTTNKSIVKSVKMLNASDPSTAKIRVELNAGQKGNFVVSLHNGSTATAAYWSWLFWIPESDPTASPQKYITEQPIVTNSNFVNPTKSYSAPLVTTFMDRNLGAMLPFNISQNQEFIRKTKGLLFQWGRKDAVPNFKGVEGAKIYIGKENLPEGSAPQYTELTDSQYNESFTESFENYNNAESEKFRNAWLNVRYSVQHPLTFLYQSGTGAIFNGGNKSDNNLNDVRDWVSADRSLLYERWGHGGKKSPFDPCPQGWRVPDTFTVSLYSGSKGNSPFYNGYKNDWTGKQGLIQDQWADVVQYYNATANPNGLIFADSVYPIGSFSADGIRGELGESAYTIERSGVWTAALADLGTGYGLGMLFKDSQMQTGTGVYPQAAMSIRCAKDEPRYLGIPVTEQNSGIANLVTDEVSAVAENRKIWFYPNPFSDELFVNTSDAETCEIYDMSGKLLKTQSVLGNKINTADMLQGAYIVKLKMKDGSTVVQKLLRK